MTETLTAARPAVQDESRWKKRFRAARIMFPLWARDDADRLIYLSNSSGTFEVHTWDRRDDVHRWKNLLTRPAVTAQYYGSPSSSSGHSNLSSAARVIPPVLNHL